jgi:hypothetical protein
MYQHLVTTWTEANGVLGPDLSAEPAPPAGMFRASSLSLVPAGYTPTPGEPVVVYLGYEPIPTEPPEPEAEPTP